MFRFLFENSYRIDFTERWVIEENWTYTADLAPFTKLLKPTNPQSTLLVFYGIDTIANIVCFHCLAYPLIFLNSLSHSEAIHSLGLTTSSGNTHLTFQI